MSDSWPAITAIPVNAIDQPLSGLTPCAWLAAQAAITDEDYYTWSAERLAQVFAAFPTASVPSACDNPHCRHVQQEWDAPDPFCDPSIIVQRTTHGYTVLAGRQRTCVAKRTDRQTVPARVFADPVAQLLPEIGQPSTFTAVYTWQPEAADSRPGGTVLGYYVALTPSDEDLVSSSTAIWGVVSVLNYGLTDYRIHPNPTEKPVRFAPGLQATIRLEPQWTRWRPKHSRRERVVCTLTIDAPVPLGKIWVAALPWAGDWIHGYHPDSTRQTVLFRRGLFWQHLRRRRVLDPPWLAAACQENSEAFASVRLSERHRS